MLHLFLAACAAVGHKSTWAIMEVLLLFGVIVQEQRPWLLSGMGTTELEMGNRCCSSR
jgi:O-antigen ligase